MRSRQNRKRKESRKYKQHKSKSFRKYSKVVAKQQEEKSQGAKQRHEETDREVQNYDWLTSHRQVYRKQNQLRHTSA